MAPKSIAASLILLFAYSSATAEEIKDEQIFQRGVWEVYKTTDTTDNRVWCTAGTFNKTYQGFDFSGWPEGTLSLTLYDKDWKITERFVKFVLDIDGSKFTINGDASVDNVFYQFQDAGLSKRLVKEVALGNRLTVFNQSGKSVAKFSLSGSSAALTSFAGCWNKVQGLDPVTSAANPFD